MADIIVKAQGGRVLFAGWTRSGREWVRRHVVTVHGTHQVTADAAAAIIAAANEAGLEVKIER